MCKIKRHLHLAKLLAVILILAGGGLFVVSGNDENLRSAIVLDIEGTIGPATNDYIRHGMDAAGRRRAELIILRMDTPGGLDTSMRLIIKQITTSNIPIVGFVAPSGARAASAGTYILYATHIAAMAPGTNLGAATPIQIGGLSPAGVDRRPNQDETISEQKTQAGDVRSNKLVNDAAAYIRGLAQMRGRNQEWAEKAVREAVSLPAREALQIGVIDLIATGIQDLLQQLDGRAVELPGEVRTLDTKGLLVATIEPDWRNRLLSIISNPNVAYVLMLVGVYGLVYEFSNPGVLLPGTVGVICLLLALFAFQALPINYAGIALILFGLALMIAEAFVPSFGVLGIGGIAAFIFGSVIFIDSDAPGYGVSLPLILAFATVSLVTLIAFVSLAVEAVKRPVVSGREQLLGEQGYAISAFSHTGRVRVHGEVWHAVTAAALKQDQLVRVTGRDGLTLLVTPENEKEA